MQWNDVSSNWTAMVDAIKARWPEASRETLADMNGERATLNAHLGQVYGLTPREAEEQINEWLQGPMPTDALMDEHHDNASIRDSASHIPVGEDVYAEDAKFGDDDVAQRPMGRSN